MTITISSEIEKALREIAARQGTTPEDVLTQTLEKTFLTPEVPQEPTLAELFAGRTGLVNSEGRYNYSSHTGKAYTESLLKQKEQNSKTKEG